MSKQLGAALRTETGIDAIVRRHFCAQSARPADWHDVSAAALSPYHRAVLVCDGTVTRTLEAHTLERIEARCVDQHEVTGDEQHSDWLAAGPDDRVLVRHAELVGQCSRIRYARAESMIAVDRLPIGFRAALEAEPAGIGAALQAAHAESHRQLLFYGRTPDSVCARCYRIIVGARPALVISEWFLR
ncbi:chorismate--pyruvate lyase family protein [Nocardia iowensis]|uniref:DUF98 domain-containing protein n=1 Tax=Nocardia iowensis TaxID=204891 RepID=A0ABX8RH72_NOCIO|nr:chorismate pyruvate-lyase family protein [Nocardia iowensis]QXN88362.1 DUF98 domain-containing protein [Nocardia iowensis]